MYKIITGMTIGLSSFLFLGVKAQLSLTGQLRVRTELRNGYGTLETLGSQPAFLTSQRARLNFNYRSSRIIFQASVQDVRVWGADASTINNADGARLSVHEAWGELVLANKHDSSLGRSPVEYFGIRVGRQELVYDDQRLLGNLDWLQQARRHDAVVLKLLDKGWQVDLGAAFNQNTDAFNYNGTSYTPANVPAYIKDSRGNLAPVPTGYIPLVNATGTSARNGSPSLVAAPSTNGANQDYKSMQFLYAAKQFNSTRLAALLFVDEFSRYKLDSAKNIAGSDTGEIYGRHFNQAGVNTRATGGLQLNTTLDSRKAWKLQAGAWYQFGRDRDGLTLAAYTTTFALTYSPHLVAGTIGWDYLSGNNAFSTSTTNHRFDPLYGTPHKFWGYMDYFYAGTGSATGGLNNPFAKAKYVSRNNRLSVELCYHYFGLAAGQKDVKGKEVSRYLGSEVDATASYGLNKITNLELGVCALRATHSMEYAKGITPDNARLNASWAYLQLNIKPDFLTK
ncbi:MAG TPA: alginate export family protein [Puia sp.]|uniref:alginate export family protein n=1 Tax=Puia sp. TaxID=2045100 RepID=UPI002C1FDE16|nr:alginate export family protein [Puia sp.]HVU96684.1 alginate export family protein [Puia sp.]